MMSSVPIFVGQCGNQIGNSLIKVLEASRDPVGLWEKHDGERSAILIDSEPKVVRTLTSQKRCGFADSNIINTRQGCGTNWALGYFGPSQKDAYRLQEESLEAVRREVEQCDAFSGFIVMHSLGGGTGSGLGSHLLEALRDDYGLAYILSCAVAPFCTGDSPLQHYNTLLTTAWLQRYSDGVLLFQNDEILRRLTKHTGTGHQHAKPSPGMKDLNRDIAESLAGVLLPIDSFNPVKGIFTYQEPWELLRSVCPVPAYKFVSILHTIKSESKWDGIIKSLLQSMRKFSHSGEKFSSVASLLIARGDSHGTFPSCISSIDKAIRAACHCVSWNPYPVDYWHGLKHFHLKPSEASATLCSNSSSVVEQLQNTHSKARLMYDAGGYLHWYKRYRCTEDIFEGAFETVQGIIDNYQSAVT